MLGLIYLHKAVGSISYSDTNLVLPTDMLSGLVYGGTLVGSHRARKADERFVFTSAIT